MLFKIFPRFSGLFTLISLTFLFGFLSQSCSIEQQANRVDVPNPDIEGDLETRDNEGEEDDPRSIETNEDDKETTESRYQYAPLDNLSLAGSYVGVVDSYLYNFDEKGEKTDRVEGEVTWSDETHKIQLPKRDQEVINVSSDLFSRI